LSTDAAVGLNVNRRAGWDWTKHSAHLSTDAAVGLNVDWTAGWEWTKHGVLTHIIRGSVALPSAAMKDLKISRSSGLAVSVPAAGGAQQIGRMV